VAFMLVHCFWFLEFKFKFEFYCLNLFKISKAFPYSFPFLLFKSAQHL
jgi:hypothetical protein